jgi:hypothetical protein
MLPVNFLKVLMDFLMTNIVQKSNEIKITKNTYKLILRKFRSRDVIPGNNTWIQKQCTL